MTTATKANKATKVTKIGNGNVVASVSGDLQEKERILQILLDTMTVNNKLHSVKVALTMSNHSGVNAKTAIFS